MYLEKSINEWANFKSHGSISMAAIPSFGRRRNFQKTFVEFQLVNNGMNRKSKAFVLLLIGDSGLIEKKHF